MNLEVWWIGKTDEKYLVQGIEKYSKKIPHYINYKEVTLKDVRNTKSPIDLRRLESEVVLNKLSSQDFLILCDEKGRTFSSIQFSKKIEKWMMNGRKRMVFLIAGAYGAHESLKDRADFTLSLSSMTYSHQMVRLILVEQLYRAFTIIRNEKYHNI